MDLIIFSSEYKNFRDAVLNNIPDVNGAIRCISNAIPPICNILNIGFIKIKLVAPVSLIARQGTNEEKIIYEDPNGYEIAPIIQTYRTKFELKSVINSTPTKFRQQNSFVTICLSSWADRV